ncbi:NAD+-dependent protein deacetylase SIR2 [Microdochium nivale]|nr:NAD+-dependent protein deacetylase SIR2 [Microdochium nivale]
MPTLQVSPTSTDLLQTVADTLGKARRVVVITGAGISTNSGIPDFRSQNGLYSLIQSQYDKAQATSLTQDDEADFETSDRPTKRRKVSTSPSPGPAENVSKQDHSDSDDSNSSGDDTATALDLPKLPPLPSSLFDSTTCDETRTDKDAPIATKSVSPPRRLTRSRASVLREPSRQAKSHSTSSTTTQEYSLSNPGLSATSSQADDPELPDDEGEGDSIHCVPYRTPKKSRLAAMFSSSPLSSPPPILWDPYENTLPSTDISSQIASDSSDDSDADNAEHSVDLFAASQESNTRLRTMKGRDLFDSNIWADPVKTSVFYRFATSLRKKVKDIEPTATHRFIAQLRDVGKLARVYTQNIDEIEKKLGLSTDLSHGAGSRRRRFAKTTAQQQVDEPNGESQQASAEISRNLQTAEVDMKNLQDDAESSERPNQKIAKPTATFDRGVECVFLHGSLSSLRCFLCGKVADWDEDDREGCTLSGEQPECPHCAGAAAARVEKGRRALGVGKLRPDIVLYGEEHPQSDLISPIVQHDLSAGPDVLLILGTSLRVHGLKIMVKEFAKSVHSKGGKVVFVNFTKPSESVWGDVLDFWVEWDCDAWVNDLRERRPNLWLSAEEVQQQEFQRREVIAEKKRESILRRENTMEKKRESMAEKQRLLIENKVPAKNPQSMRNDMQCGAFVVWEIMQSLAKVGERPFDNLVRVVEEAPIRAQETPVPPPVLPDFILRPKPENSISIPTSASENPGVSQTASQVMDIAAEGSTEATVPAKLRASARTKRARKSTPADIQTVSREESENIGTASRHHPSPSSMSKFIQAAGKLPRASDTDQIMRLHALSQPPTPPSPQNTIVLPPAAAPDVSNTSIGAAVKTNPRQRKPKVWYDPTPEKEIRQASKRVLPPPNPSPSLQHFQQQHQQAKHFPGYESRTFPAPISITATGLAPFLEMKPQLSPLQCPSRNIRPAPFIIPEEAFAMRYSDPLGKLGYHTCSERTASTKAEQPTGSTARQDMGHAPSEQLLREEAAQTLAWMQGVRGH